MADGCYVTIQLSVWKVLQLIGSCLTTVPLTYYLCNMETDNLNDDCQLSIPQRLLSAVIPVLFIAVGYVDPGKWVAAIEGGARFGYDFVTLMLVFNCAAILCQYLSARIAVVTGRDLAQHLPSLLVPKICSEEYDKFTCIFLGVQAELSMIALDLSMILGTAHGLNLMLGLDLFTCVSLTAVDAFLFPLFSTFVENGKARFLCICMASFILVSYLFGVLMSQPEIPLSTGGMLTKLSGESVFGLMSLLGANIMPHNFYLHSAIVQQDQGQTNVSKGALCHDHFFAVLCVFSGIFLANFVLINSAANVFYSTGLVLLTFQDALSLMDQVFRSLMAPFALILVLVLSNHSTALTWKLGGQVVLHNFFRIHVPGWLHHSTIRAIAIIPALYCVWNSGAEGIYQLLIFTQIMVALLLPSSVIPLFRVASSRSVMGVLKISKFVEFLVLITFIGILGLEIIFVIETIFGNSDWATNLRWNMGISMPAPYIVLVITASISLCLMLWLAATPLKSASTRLDPQAWNWDIQSSAPESSTERDDSEFIEARDHVEDVIQKQEPTSSFEESKGTHSDMSITTPDLNLPETILDSSCKPPLTSREENSFHITYSSPFACHSEESATTMEMPPGSTVCNQVSDCQSVDVKALMTKPADLVEKTLGVDGGLPTEKDDEGDAWEPEDSSKDASLGSPSPMSEGPGSYRSVSGKNDDLGSGAGSLSRLAGLGRAARRQLAVSLDEFWGQLFDFHGQATQEAKTKKLDALLGIDMKVDQKSAISPLKVENSGKEFGGYFPSVGGRGSDLLINSRLYDSPRQQSLHGRLESSYGVQRESPLLWSSQLLDAYVKNPSHNALDLGERRYTSLRLPPSSAGLDDQPATIHGYQTASHVNRLGRERGSDYFNSQIEPLASKSPSLASSKYKDPYAFALPQRPQNGLSSMKPPGFPSLPVSRISSMHSRPLNDLFPAGPTENVGSAANVKKYHSLPDISGLSLPYRNTLLSDRGAQRDPPPGYRPSVGRTMYEQSLYSSASSKAGAPLTSDEISSSKVCRDAFSLQFNSSSTTGSLWKMQPFEQFGVADKVRSAEGGVGSWSLGTQEISSVDFESKLLQSFRHCIVKLLKLEGSEWLFRQNDGADEDLIDRVAARERFLYEAETREMNRAIHVGESQFVSDRKFGSAQKIEDIDYAKLLVTSVPHCGEGCIWRVDLIISFGVWCIHRVLELSLMESRPELWGKYTYVLNRLQGIVDLAFFKPRSPMPPCFCLEIPVAYQQSLSPPISNGSLPPPPAKPGRGKLTTGAMLLDIIKDVELAISSRKGRTGTAAGDVAFPKGKENLASVLKRYKRRLSNKTVGNHEGGAGSRKGPTSTPYGS
ncbi:hypothetical protein RJ639_013117 [Escallonia herrerae]|uniref:Ethylene-insensitive protein 2 n=1 Tax=Escallonia herrerae TaxID=1293975 RepID=A0AA89AMR4_9ASTE|nr:hypothetical protein RJ639_013117 [Escallonia herrerae]